jgi:hypothetical protein
MSAEALPTKAPVAPASAALTGSPTAPTRRTF